MIWVLIIFIVIFIFIVLIAVIDYMAEVEEDEMDNDPSYIREQKLEKLLE